MTKTIDEALKALYQSKGRLDPHDVVEAARNPRSPLHSRFEWNNDQAAELYRIQQARALIREVQIERIDATGETRQVRRYVHDPKDDGYLLVTDIAKMPDVRDRVLDDMRRDLERLRDKWSLYDATFKALASEILASEIVDDEDDNGATAAS